MTVATLEALRRFSQTQEYTPELNGLLTEIAATGVVRYPWSDLQPLFCRRLEDVVKETSQGTASEDVWRPLCEAMKGMKGVPFTAQRLSELLVAPRKQYADVKKLLSALTKLISVTSFVDIATDPPPLPSLVDLPDVNENPSPVRPRHVASSEVFKGFLESKPPLEANGSSESAGLTAHLFGSQE